MPHPLGSSRSHPAPHEFISCPTCLPGWWTSRMGTRPCSGVGLSLEPGTSTSLLIQFNSWRQKILEIAVMSTDNFESLDRGKKLNKQLCDISGYRDLLRYLVFGDVVAHRLLPQVTLTAVFRYTSQYQLLPLLLIHLWNKQPTLQTLGWEESTESERHYVTQEEALTISRINHGMEISQLVGVLFKLQKWVLYMSFHIINMGKQLEFWMRSLKNDGDIPADSSSNSEVVSTSVEEVSLYGALCLHSFQEE